jgi:hypothetical protein
VRQRELRDVEVKVEEVTYAASAEEAVAVCGLEEAKAEVGWTAEGDS